LIATPSVTERFSTLAGGYDAVLSDVWGVIHNGIKATMAACDALTRFREQGGTVMLITNAPRPGATVIKFIDKVGAKLLLNRNAAGNSDIDAADLADLLARSGIDLIAERIESESMVVDLLDYDVRFGQGFLFSPPRPVRAEALQGGSLEPAPAPASTSEPLELKNELIAAGGRR
jgi:hypothetical protein